MGCINGFSWEGELCRFAFVFTFEIGVGRNGAPTAACPIEFFPSVNLPFTAIALLLSVNLFGSSAERIGVDSNGGLTAACPIDFDSSVNLPFTVIGLLLSVNLFRSSAERIVWSSDENCGNGYLSVSVVEKDDTKVGFGTESIEVLGRPESNVVPA